VHRVLYHYNGPVWWDIGELTVMLLTVAAILALLCAVIGLFTLRQQRPNTWQFILTIVGLVGTGLPSILVITAVFLSDKYFDGDVTCGICPVIMPLSMIICIFAVLRRKNHVTEQLRREALAKGLIRKAGDL
jgi:ABC-type Fe3+ transport system permease subunit